MGNLILLIFSLFFYAWGETSYIVVMLVSILANYLFGIAIDRAPDGSRKFWLATGIGFNLTLLLFFKYAVFIVHNVNYLFGANGEAVFEIGTIHLPIGISFFTFQAMSYIVDVYRGEVRVQHEVTKVALYISLFPQLIAGPIVRYKDVEEQMENRTSTVADINLGIERFICGLGKKILIANPMGELADLVMGAPSPELSVSIAWIGVLAYALQIYFDFSGYSDMAIGLGRIFGFIFPENFRHPYISLSIREFWRRWHISLSTWFRDYLYIPLGGNQCSTWRAYFNLWIVFFLCGLWHGASWNFVIWGAIHGLFIVLERTNVGRLFSKTWKPMQHIYTLLVVLIGWVFFRMENLGDALNYLRAMFGFEGWMIDTPALSLYLTNERILVFLVGVVCATPILQWIRSSTSTAEQKSTSTSHLVYVGVGSLKFCALLVILTLSLGYISASTYNPFIYFRF